jgi:hypothetical protein
MRRFAFSFAALALVAAGAAAGAGAGSPVRVTVVGDSVAGALDYSDAAKRSLDSGLDVRFDLRVCRRLATTSCPYAGGVPSSALDVVRGAGRSLGQVLVVDVGYNDDPAVYTRGMGDVIRAARQSGVQRIIWVTLRATNALYARTDAVIRAEAIRFPDVEVADWNAFSRGKPWFRPDGLHLNVAGAAGLAALLRPLILQAAAAQAP